MTKLENELREFIYKAIDEFMEQFTIIESEVDDIEEKIESVTDTIMSALRMSENEMYESFLNGDVEPMVTSVIKKHKEKYK